MTVTYPHDRPVPQDSLAGNIRDEPVIPVYARDRRTTRGRKGGVRTWMILAPIGVLVLGAGAAAMVMGGRDDVAPAPLIEPAATGPVLPPQPLTAAASPGEAPVATPVVEAAAAPAQTRAQAPAPVARRTSPARRAPAAPAAEPAAAVVEPTTPRPYTAELNADPASAPAGPPVIVIQPAD
jgi:hypothetical protein